jgi:hypothetical protein
VVVKCCKTIALTITIISISEAKMKNRVPTRHEPFDWAGSTHISKQKEFRTFPWRMVAGGYTLHDRL